MEEDTNHWKAYNDKSLRGRRQFILPLSPFCQGQVISQNTVKIKILENYEKKIISNYKYSLFPGQGFRILCLKSIH